MHRPFRFGVVTGNAQSHTEWVTLARKAEELGYATLLIPDRTTMGLAPFTALAVAAEATTALRIGSFVFCNDYRHPALLAKEVATLDLLSQGRFELGLGVGAGPVDYKQLGLPFESAGARVSRLEEALHIIKRLFSEEIVNFSGKYYTITDMKGLPRPVQKPYLPIFIGSAGKTDALDCRPASRYHCHHVQNDRTGGRSVGRDPAAKVGLGARSSWRAFRSIGTEPDGLLYRDHRQSSQRRFPDKRTSQFYTQHTDECRAGGCTSA